MRPTWASAFRVLTLLALALGVQWISGAFQSETTGNPDEPAHLVTGLMARDYLRSGWGTDPVEFARGYYLHYPKVAMGHWPPIFYVQQALWTLLFPASRNVLLLLIALQCALLGSFAWTFLRDRFGSAAAWLGCLILATSPGFAAQSSQIMAEIPQALLILLATLAWGRYLDTGRARQAAVFGLWSAAAILTKGTGLVLAGIPLISIWSAGRQSLARRASFWAPALIVACICGPWYLLAPDALHQRVASYGGVGIALRRLNLPPTMWAEQLGWVLASMALLGLAALLYQRFTGHTLDGIWSSASALVIAASILPLFVGAWEPRHQVEITPAFLFLAASGTAWLASLSPVRTLSLSLRVSILALACFLTAGWNLSSLPRQEPWGYRELTNAILANAFGPARTILIAGDSLAEGGLIAEVAQREPHPHRYVVRGSKLFADIRWMGQLTNLRVKNSDEMNALLSSLPIDLVLIDRMAAAPYAYQPWLEQALAQHPDQWREIQNPAAGQRFAVFARATAVVLSTMQIESQLRAVLGEPIP